MTGIKLLLATLLVALFAAVVGLPAQAPTATTSPEIPRAGALCCYGDVCVEWSGSSCSGDLGWSDYSTELDADTGILVAERSTL